VGPLARSLHPVCGRPLSRRAGGKQIERPPSSLSALCKLSASSQLSPSSLEAPSSKLQAPSLPPATSHQLSAGRLSPAAAAEVQPVGGCNCLWGASWSFCSRGAFCALAARPEAAHNGRRLARGELRGQLSIARQDAGESREWASRSSANDSSGASSHAIWAASAQRAVASSERPAVCGRLWAADCLALCWPPLHCSARSQSTALWTDPNTLLHVRPKRQTLGPKGTLKTPPKRPHAPETSSGAPEDAKLPALAGGAPVPYH